MYLRSLIICSYLMIAYWVSTQFPSLKMVFYPTLGAFSFIFIQRVGQMKDVKRIILGAAIASTIGSMMYALDNGVMSFFATAIITISLIHFFKWNAAPILAVSLIPYFAHPVSIWTLPVAVVVSLIGLLLTLWLIGKIEQMTWVSKLSLMIQKTIQNIARPTSRQPVSETRETSN